MKSDLICKDDISNAASVLRAINHPLRSNILYLLEKRKILTVTEIFEQMKISQTVCSTHLAILRKAGVIAVDRTGSKRCYYIVHSRMIEINSYCRALVGEDINVTESLTPQTH